ncbi:hypothetical protein N7539_007083 [Penicillium diatomitis]|uniref:Uncharacterized protein n=1 Tax=Penicillium diatomitis TaxID=2819901 RepID=A0A9W9WUH6_9EURO|nr:uncharacterized protein N7539_007083 [Penicillium diatomitis]KAJ5476939.1 hypothetical protein N7539_007083 [Penicillium diatomitis]
MSCTRLDSSPPSSPTKRRMVGVTPESLFPYPKLDSDCVNDDDGEGTEPACSYRKCRRIQITDSILWGTPALAAERALAEPRVTPENEALFRTYHPSLALCQEVHLIEEENGTWMWGILPEAEKTHNIGSHAGDLEIHFEALGYISPTITIFPMLQHDPIPRPINPRKFLSRNQLRRLRDMFPTALGVRILISGFIVVLFKTIKDIEKSWYEDGFACSFGNLRLRYDVLEVTPTVQVVQRGAAISAEPEDLRSLASLGLKLRFSDGREVITVPTHAFVTLRDGDRSTPTRFLADVYARLKQRLARYRPLRRGTPSPAIGFSRCESKGNSVVGKRVFLAGGSQEVGVISSSYDEVSQKPLRFPVGFQHDLSLTSANLAPLPDLQAPPKTPRVTGWGEYQALLNGGPAFVTGFNINTGNLKKFECTGISRQAQVAISEGSQYCWDRTVTSQSVSLLWRTGHDWDSVTGLSGSALCLGNLADNTCLAVCFQNFECPLATRDLLKDDHRPLPIPQHRMTIKGGFLLPPDVRETEILCSPSGASRDYGTYPRSSSHTEGLRRSFSSTN